MIVYDTTNWPGMLARVRGSVIPAVFMRVLITAALGGLAAWLFHRYQFKVPPVAHTMLGIALGLLLVFRTNASYDRWWEGRKLLAVIVNESRNVARQATSLIGGDDEGAKRTRTTIARHVGLLYALIRQRLRNERDLDALGDRLLPPDERSKLNEVDARPCVVAAWISTGIADAAAEGRLSEPRVAAMERNLSALVSAMGDAERIGTTPIPFAYAHFIKLFLVLFCFTAPFAIVEALLWYTPVASAIFSFALFGIDEIGIEIEDPFGYDDNDLPLDELGEQIESETAEIVASRAA